MHRPAGRTPSSLAAAVAAVAIALAACSGPAAPTIDPLGDDEAAAGDGSASPGDDRTEGGADVLSPCSPAGGEASMLVERTDDRPPLATMEAALEDNPDGRFMVEQLEAGGTSHEDAVHALYGQVVGDGLLAAARQLPGFVTGAYASPQDGEPFELAFEGPVPAAFDPADHDLASYGLLVITGVAQLDPDAVSAAMDAALEVGIRPLAGYGDELAGTVTVEVIDATPAQVASWEQLLADAERVCLVRAPRSVECGPAVVADAEERAARQDELYPVADDGVTEDGGPAPDRADTVRRSYLGLTVDDARAKGDVERRTVRVVVEDGVQLAVNDDLQPSRLNLTVCRDVVVDAVFDLEL